MDEVMTLPSAENAAQLRQTLSHYLVEIDRLREIMKQDDIEIARSQARTSTLLTEIKAMRASAERKAK